MTKPVCAVIGIGPKNGAAFARRFSAEGYALALLSRSTGYSEEFERSWRINTLGALVASQQVIPGMKDSGAGSIIFVGATASLRGVPMTAGFAPAKVAQRILAQSMAKHLGPQGIHVSVLIIDGQIGDPESEPA